ncbi:unnamed protein product, partial [Mesorhabditis belari]|uniref:RING-type domain-containing protein n=1 Tax=Mesorhabditis belari TaxID=2138241 RepID=A0AAF3F2N4_9BILA
MQQQQQHQQHQQQQQQQHQQHQQQQQQRPGVPPAMMGMAPMNYPFGPGGPMMGRMPLQPMPPQPMQTPRGPMMHPVNRIQIANQQQPQQIPIAPPPVPFNAYNPIQQLGQNSQPGPSNQNNEAGLSSDETQSRKGRSFPYEWYFRCGLCRGDYGSDGKNRPCFLNGDHICESCADFEIENSGNESRKIIYYAFVDVLSISKDPKALLNLLTGEVHRETNPFECSVCMENYNTAQNAPTVMTCGHAVCLHCYNMIENCPRCGLVLVKSGNSGNDEDVPGLSIQQPRPFYQGNPGMPRNQMEPMYGGQFPHFGYGQNQGYQQNQGNMMAANNQPPQDSIVLVLTKHFRSFVTLLVAAHSRKRKRAQEEEEEDEHNNSLTDSQPPATPEQNVPKVSCEECKRSVDLNDMFNCLTCNEKKVCSRCMFRKHQKEMGHEVRELVNEKINGMLKETQLFTDNQYETYLGIVPNLNQKIIEEFKRLPDLLTTAYDSIGSNSHSSFDAAKEKLNDCRRIGKRLEKISEDYVPQARKYIKRLTELVEYAQMKFPSPIDPFHRVKSEAITPPHQDVSQSNSSPFNHRHDEMFSEENHYSFFE